MYFEVWTFAWAPLCKVVQTSKWLIMCSDFPVFGSVFYMYIVTDQINQYTVPNSSNNIRCTDKKIHLSVYAIRAYLCQLNYNSTNVEEVYIHSAKDTTCTYHWELRTVNCRYGAVAIRPLCMRIRRKNLYHVFYVHCVMRRTEIGSYDRSSKFCFSVFENALESSYRRSVVYVSFICTRFGIECKNVAYLQGDS